MKESKTVPESSGHKNVGPIISTLVIILVLIIAALYILGSHINHQSRYVGSTIDSTTTEVISASSTNSSSPQTANKSDDVDSLKKYLEGATSALNP